MSGGPSTFAVLTSVAGSGALSVVKIVAAVLSGSAGMMASAVYSLLDTGNSLLLYWGLRRSARPADRLHPFGHGMELYFWTLLVALLLIAVAGGATVAEGVVHLIKPASLNHLAWSYAVLGAAALFTGCTWAVALKRFLASKGDDSWWDAVRNSKDTTVLTLLLEETASLIGVALAFLGLLLAQLLDVPHLEAAASVLIGVVMMGVACVLVYETRSLLTGESADVEVVDGIRSVVKAEESVEEIVDLLTMHFGPREILVNLKISFRGGLGTRELGEAVDRLEAALRAKYTKVRRIFIEPGPLGGALRRDPAAHGPAGGRH
jgi:cation diffusion facilitator family transporter